ncbi:NADH-dependent flavin oxidoreductase [Rhizina undulata]
MASAGLPKDYQPKNTPAPNTPYFTPLQSPPSGTAAPLESQPVVNTAEKFPPLFKPLKIRDAEFPNKIFCAPMCMYSADYGKLTDFHLMHLGGIAFRGPGLVMVEATAVMPEGRISPEDSGIWEDAQIEPLKRIVTFIHSQSHHVSLQLAHAGRKASTVAPWLGDERGKSILAGEGIGGWPSAVVAPSAIPWDDLHANPRELSIPEIKSLVKAFGDGAERALKAGIDSLEIHAAHGYLIHEFLSPVSNTRTDEYGGSFENRIRFLKEIAFEVRSRMPAGMPLFVRVSATDWLESIYPEAWEIEQTARLAKVLYGWGVDLIDVSSGGNHPKQKFGMHSDYQIDLAARVRRELDAEGGDAKKLLVGAVGGIVEGKQANDILVKGKADVVFVARQFLREPNFVLRAAKDLEIEVKWPNQYMRAVVRKAKPSR